MSNKARFSIGFDLDNPEHVTAYEKLLAYLYRRRSEMVIRAILALGEKEELKALISEAAQQGMAARNEIPHSPTQPINAPNADANALASEELIPNAALSFIQGL